MTRRFWIRAALIGSGILVVLVTVEIALRIAQGVGIAPDYFRRLNSAYTPFDVKTGEGLYYAHPYISYDMKPGYAIPGVTINSLGFRGAEFAAKKPAGTYRIVALGGSTTYGTQLTDEHTYPFLLERELRQQLQSNRIEVINAGLVSATSAESLARFLLRVVGLEPDLVIFYEGYNDLPPRMFEGYSDDYYHFRKFPQNRDSFWSRLLTYRVAAAGFAARLHYPNVTLLSETWKFENLPAGAEARIANFDRTSPAVYERNLSYMIDIAKARQIPFVLATFAFNDAVPNWNDDMPDPLWSKGIGQHNDIVRSLADRHRLPVVPFHEFGLQHPEIFKDSVHMTAAGNLEMARLFAGTLLPIVQSRLAIPAADTNTGRPR